MFDIEAYRMEVLELMEVRLARKFVPAIFYFSLLINGAV
jgi:hypothetical protein